jgi:hypothetical protein
MSSSRTGAVTALRSSVFTAEPVMSKLWRFGNDPLKNRFFSLTHPVKEILGKYSHPSIMTVSRLLQLLPTDKQSGLLVVKDMEE